MSIVNLWAVLRAKPTINKKKLSTIIHVILVSFYFLKLGWETNTKATTHQPWKKWVWYFEIYVITAGCVNDRQKRQLFVHLAELKVQHIVLLYKILVRTTRQLQTIQHITYFITCWKWNWTRQNCDFSPNILHHARTFTHPTTGGERK